MKQFFIIAHLILFLFGKLEMKSQIYDGYTLYNVTGGYTTYLLDVNKNIYHSWSCNTALSYVVYLLPDGSILRPARNTGNILNGAAVAGRIQKYHWNGTLLWDYVYSTSTYCTHHDIEPLPNGNVLLISWDYKTAAENSAAGCTSAGSRYSEKIIEVQPVGATGGNIVWEWKLWDHLIQSVDSTKSNYGVIKDNPGRLNINYKNTISDWFHMNSIDYNAELDQITFSSHNLNEIYVIDHSTTTAQAAGKTGGKSGKGGDFLYRWGNPEAYGAGTISNRIFKVVHDSRWIPDGYPNQKKMMAFNNTGGVGNSSVVDVIDPPYNGFNYLLTPGSAYAPSSYFIRHQCVKNASGQSGAHYLPNGNLFVSLNNGYLYEVNTSGVEVWNYTIGGNIGKAFKYGLDYIMSIPDNNKNVQNISVYPNPSDGFVTIEESYAEDFELFVYDTYGKLLMQVQNPKSIDFSGYGNGIYFLSFRTKDNQLVTKRISIIK